MSRLLFWGTVLANRATAPATTGLATDVPVSPLEDQIESFVIYEIQMRGGNNHKTLVP